MPAALIHNYFLLQVRHKEETRGSPVGGWIVHDPRFHQGIIYVFEPYYEIKQSKDDLPSHEIANGIEEILKNQISLTKADLVKETSRLFGFARIGTNVETVMLGGIRKALSKGFAKMQDDRIVFCE